MKCQKRRKGKEANGFASVGRSETRRKEDTELGDRIGNKSERWVGSHCYIHGDGSNEKLEVTQPLQATPQGESGTKNRATIGDQGCPWWPGRVQGDQNMSKLTNLTLASPRHGSLPLSLERGQEPMRDGGNRRSSPEWQSSTLQSSMSRRFRQGTLGEWLSRSLSADGRGCTTHSRQYHLDGERFNEVPLLRRRCIQGC